MEGDYSETIFDSNSNKIVLRCKLCNKNCDTQDVLESHNKSKAHIKKASCQNINNLNNTVSNISLNENISSTNIANFGFNCQICDISCNTKDQLDKHNLGKIHQKKALKYDYKNYNLTKSPEKSVDEIISQKTCLNEDIVTNSVDKTSLNVDVKISPLINDILIPDRKPNWITCRLCNTDTNTEEQYLFHCNGSKHKKRLSSLNIPEEMVEREKISDNDCEKCTVCNITIHKNNVDSHNKGKLHKEKMVKSTTKEDTDVIVRKINLSIKLNNLEYLKLKPRKYQLEIYEKALRNDCVVFLPTGTGKTFIGAMLILKMLEENAHHRVAFIVDKVLLVMQQHEFLKNQFEEITLTRFVSKTETEIRKIRLIGMASDLVATEHHLSIRDHDIIVATADLFKNSLNKNQLFWTDFSMVILDEAHHCVKEHPYKRLLHQFHLYPQQILVNNSNYANIDQNEIPQVDDEKHKQWKLRRCKLIGLTASPAGDLDADCTLQLLEKLLQSLGDVDIVNVVDNIEELSIFTSLTNIETKMINYGRKESELRDVISEAFIFLLKKFERLVNGIGNDILVNENNKLSIEDIGNLKSQISGFLADLEGVHNSVLKHILHLVDIIEAIDSIGYKIAVGKYRELVDNENDKVWFCNNVFKFSENTSKFINTDDDMESDNSSFIDTIMEECNNSGEGQRTILLLVKERKVAQQIHNVLKQTYVSNKSNFEAILLVGHGGKGGKNKQKGMSVTKQKQALDFIREKKSQIIIATSVADEGIDLPECDLVIIINPPNSVQALVQIRGRARKKSSRLLMLCRDQQSIDSLNNLKIKEENIIKSINTILSKKLSASQTI